jgi:DNA-binding transcriptional LysR family regulator
MDIRHLQYFMEVARFKSFSKAADMLHVSQPSISKAIKELESQLGVTLLYRSTKYVELTDAGEAILEQAQQIVSSFQNINIRLNGITKLQAGKIHVGLPPITGVADFAYILGGFKNEYPNIEIILSEFGSKIIESGIQEGSLDVGIIHIPPEESHLYEIISFFRDPLRIVMHPEHALTSKSVVNFADLKDEPFVLYSKDYTLHDAIKERCKNAGFLPKVIFETSQRELMTQTVAARLGVAMLPSKICSELPSLLLVSRPMVDPLYLQLGLVWKKGRYLSHAVRELILFTKVQLEQLETKPNNPS